MPLRRPVANIEPPSLIPPAINALLSHLIEDDLPAPKKRKTAAKAVPPARLPMLVPFPTSESMNKGPFPVVTHDDTTPLVRQIGIELTMMPPNMLKDDHDSELCDAYSSLMQVSLGRDKVYKKRWDRTDKSPKGIHADQYCVECPSPILKTWGDVKFFYDIVSGHMRQLNMVSHVANYNTGGGHIHVGKLEADLMCVIFRALQNRAWLRWVFNDPDDNSSSKDFCTGLESVPQKMREAVEKATFPISDLFTGVNEYSSSNMSDKLKLAIVFCGNPKQVVYSALPASKGDMLAYRSNFKTLEFRLFEAPLNWEEQEAQVRFVEALITWAEKRLKEGKWETTTLCTAEQRDELTLEQCKARFTMFLIELGLPLAPYSRMVKDNLETVFQRRKPTIRKKAIAVVEESRTARERRRAFARGDECPVCEYEEDDCNCSE